MPAWDLRCPPESGSPLLLRQLLSPVENKFSSLLIIFWVNAMRVAALVNYKLIASPITLITRKQAALTKREHRLWRCLSLIYLLIRHLCNFFLGGKIKHYVIYAFIHFVIYLWHRADITRGTIFKIRCKDTTFF